MKSKETSTVRRNLMEQEGYSPYCGNMKPARQFDGCSNPRTYWNGEQFQCPECGWTSCFPDDFIDRYKTKWHNGKAN